MHVAQKHITTIQVQGAEVSDFVLVKDQRGCLLTIVADDDVVHLKLGWREFQKLSNELKKANHEEPAKEPASFAYEYERQPVAVEWHYFPSNTPDWLSYN